MSMKNIAIITLIIVGISATIGCITKSSYKSEPMSSYYVAQMPDNLLSNSIERMKNELGDSGTILKVKAKKEQEFIFRRTKQCVTVVNVYKGENINPGDDITIVAGNSGIDFKCMQLDTGFANAMIPGDEYLVFLDPQLDTLDKNERVFITPNYLFATIFSCKQRENVIAIPESSENTYVPYLEVKDNEFFLMSQSGVDQMNNFKELILNKYSN